MPVVPIIPFLLMVMRWHIMASIWIVITATITFQHLTDEGIRSIGNAVVVMAENEQLEAHANADARESE